MTIKPYIADRLNPPPTEFERALARIAELEKALREAMEWNWLDEDMNQGVANACERVLNGGTF
jgi:hypothetical protein